MCKGAEPRQIRRQKDQNLSISHDLLPIRQSERVYELKRARQLSSHYYVTGRSFMLDYSSDQLASAYDLTDDTVESPQGPKIWLKKSEEWQDLAVLHGFSFPFQFLIPRSGGRSSSRPRLPQGMTMTLRECVDRRDTDLREELAFSPYKRP